MDGVIIDSEPVYFRVEQEIFRELGLELTREEHSKYVGRSDLWETVKKRYELDFDLGEIREKEQNRYLSYIETSYEKGPINGVAQTIQTLDKKGITLVLASSSRMKNINLVLDKFNLSKYFSFRVSGADLETSKPHPEIYLKAAEMAGTPPKNCLAIEDSTNGVRSAKAAGMRCIGYKNPNSGNQDLSSADWIISGFDEFDLDRFNSPAD